MNDTSVAIPVTDGFEQVEMVCPRAALESVDATTKIISSKHGKVEGFNHDVGADQFDVDLSFDEAYLQDFDAVLLLGGRLNAQQIRSIPEMQRMVQGMQQDDKPISIICHATWLLVSAGLANGRTLTNWPTLPDDILNAGGNWVDQEVVVDRKLISSRKPDDIPAFSRKIVETLAQRVKESVRGTQNEQAEVGASS
ncbi:MAG TPA: type 1 glutamine amidotransferase domain-containing protein [Burkholderiaceae bacterium]|nr:type 1 glutamine amidotransferase domain-containing protein [Burkholderiaceae bacterium]